MWYLSSFNRLTASNGYIDVGWSCYKRPGSLGERFAETTPSHRKKGGFYCKFPSESSSKLLEPSEETFLAIQSSENLKNCRNGSRTSLVEGGMMKPLTLWVTWTYLDITLM